MAGGGEQRGEVEDMKFKMDIDCTPEEARAFLGLPEVAAMQRAAMETLEKRMAEGLAAMDTEALLRTWMPGDLKDWGEMQKSFWSKVMAGGAARDEKT